jgi:hypothetical protein
MLTEYHHNLSSPSNVSRMIKSRMMRLVGQVAHTGIRKCTRFWFESPKLRD